MITVSDSNSSASFQSDEVTLSTENGDALKIKRNRNGTLETVFLAQGAWAISGSTKTFSSDKTASVFPDEKKKLQIDLSEPDPYYYKDYSSRGYNVYESACKVYEKVWWVTWYGLPNKGDSNEFDRVTQLAIYCAAGRNNLYAIAGRVKNMARTEENVSLTDLYKSELVLGGYVPGREVYV